MPAPNSTKKSELEQLLETLTGESSCPGNRALATFLENSSDPVLFFTEQAELIGKNQRAFELWDGVDAFIPPRLINLVSQVDESGSSFSEIKKNRLVAIQSARGGRRFFLPTVFKLLDARPDSAEMPCRRVVACILKDETIWERSERIRNNLLSSISHELNTPLTSARLALYLLAEQRIGELNPKQLELVESSKQDLDREIVTIQNVIDMIQAKDEERNQNETEELNLHNLIEEAIGAFESQIKGMSLRIDRRYSHTSPWVEIEREVGELVIHQLFVSILKYSNHDTRLHVASSIENGDCMLELTTTDFEPADFPPDDLFTLQMECLRTRKLRCADLGLRVAHEMVTPLGGTLGSERSGTSGVLRFSFPRLQR